MLINFILHFNFLRVDSEIWNENIVKNKPSISNKKIETLFIQFLYFVAYDDELKSSIWTEFLAVRRW